MPRNVPSDFEWDFEEPESEGDDNSDSDSSEEATEESDVTVVSAEDKEHHLSRLDKALRQVIVLVAQKKKSGVFTCKSATRNGQKYLVRIKTIPSCTCLDYEQVSVYIKIIISTYN